jgi:thiol-disulfide isomerase/thioredoxin
MFKSWRSSIKFRIVSLFILLIVTSLAWGGGLVKLNSNPLAPDFELPDIGGELHRLSEHRGDVVLVNFWASWCAPCRAEMPSLERLQQSLSDTDFHILAINIGESKRQISDFYFSIAPVPSFSLLMDEDMAASQYWPMRGLPMSFLLDRNGRVTHVSQGAQHWDSHKVKALIKELQAAAPDKA